MTPDDPRHGTSAGYDAHRRARQNACPPCKAAAARAKNLRRLYPGPRITDVAPSARRIQALVALGWTYGQIGKWLDVSHDMPPKWAHQRGTGIRTSVARRIAKTYEARSMTTPPTTTGRDRWRISYAQTTARRNGWQPPLAWDDIDAGILADTPADERPGGRGMWHVHIAEDHAWLASCGESDEQIARRLGLSLDGLHKALERNRKAA